MARVSEYGSAVHRITAAGMLLLIAGTAWTLGSAEQIKKSGGQERSGTRTLEQQIRAMLAEPAIVRAHWGVMVAAMDGKPIYVLNAGEFFHPASNAKLFTTSAALALLGPEKTFETEIRSEGKISESILHGDLVLIGGGDANLSGREMPYAASAPGAKGALPPRADPLGYLAQMADQVAAAGVKTIAGDVIGDDTFFPREPYPEDWAIDDAVWGYGAPVSALSVADNQVKLMVAPGRQAGDPGVVTLDQAVEYYAVNAEIATVAASDKGAAIQVERLPGSRVLRVYGTIAANASTDEEEIAIEDPAEYAAMALKAMLEARGILVEGRARARHRIMTNGAAFLDQMKHQGAEEAVVSRGTVSGSCLFTPPLSEGLVLARHESPKLGDDVTVTNKVSQNLHAELLLHQLGRRAFCEGGSAAEGAEVVRAFLIHAGIDKDDFVFFDGSGLSGHDLVTPRAVVKLLQFASTQSWFRAYRASLPIGGIDGSLEARFVRPPLKGHVFAKTGTLGEARALSGYLECTSGRTVIFSVMVDSHAPGTSVDREVMDRIVAAIANME